MRSPLASPVLTAVVAGKRPSLGHLISVRYHAADPVDHEGLQWG